MPIIAALFALLVPLLVVDNVLLAPRAEAAGLTLAYDDNLYPDWNDDEDDDQDQAYDNDDYDDDDQDDDSAHGPDGDEGDWDTEEGLRSERA